MRKTTKIVPIMTGGLLAVLFATCSDINRQNGPVELIVTITQNTSMIDIESGAAGSSTSLGTVNLRTLFHQDGTSMPTDNTFNDILLRSYRVTYVRTDGGHQVPEPFVRTISGTLSSGAAASMLNNFQAFERGAFDHPPFAALLPRNGGRDPETGKPFVQMEVIIEVSGETLAGERVSGTARSPLTFSFHIEGGGASSIIAGNHETKGNNAS